MKAVIIGAGLGGLLAGARLVNAGYDVEIFERLPFIGGRFANLDYRGFRLSTGALHMIPHGNSGPLAHMLRQVGAEVTIQNSNPSAVIRTENSGDIMLNDFRKLLSRSENIKITALALAYRVFKPENSISFKEWILKYFDNEFLVKLADSFCGWALSLQAEYVPAREMLEITDNIHRYGGPGVPIGGCSAVTESLASVINSEGGKINTEACVDKIIVDKNRAKGICVNGNIIISPVTHSITIPQKAPQ